MLIIKILLNSQIIFQNKSLSTKKSDITTFNKKASYNTFNKKVSYNKKRNPPPPPGQKYKNK